MSFNVCPSCKAYHPGRATSCGCGYSEPEVSDETKKRIIDEYLANPQARMDLFRRMTSSLYAVIPCPAGTTCSSCGSEEVDRSMSPLGSAFSGSIICKACGRRESVMVHIAKTAFPVQKMPDGALPFYDRDPGIPDIVLEELPEDLQELPGRLEKGQ